MVWEEVVVFREVLLVCLCMDGGDSWPLWEGAIELSLVGGSVDVTEEKMADSSRS